MRLRKWVICSVCDRKYRADGDSNYPVRHNTPPTKFVYGEVTYLVNTGWGSDKEECKGTHKKGKPVEGG